MLTVWKLKRGCSDIFEVTSVVEYYQCVYSKEVKENLCDQCNFKYNLIDCMHSEKLHFLIVVSQIIFKLSGEISA